MTWNQMYKNASKMVNPRDISPFLFGGRVVSAIQTDKGNVYYGANLDAKCNWGYCAERAAIANMLLYGESKIVKILSVDKNGLRIPCGICREALMQLHKDNGELEILTDLKTEKTIKLKTLIPNWWGTERFVQEIAKEKR